MKPRDLLQYRKDPRIVIAVPVILLIATSLVYYLVERAKELSPEALSSRLLLFVLWNINLILIFGILFVLLRGVIKLLLERQRGIIGSRFRTKLVVTYVATSLVPIVLLFFVATDLLRVSIDRWFNTPVSSILRNSEAIADADQKRVISEASRASQELAESIANNETLEEAITHVRRYHPVDLVGTYEKRSVVKLVADPRAPVYELREPSSRFFDDVREKGWAQKLDETPDGKWIRYGRRVGNPADEVVAVAGIFLPNTLSRMIDENLIASRNFKQLNSQRSALKASQTSLFLTVTLYILFGALWTAIYASRRIAVPIQALAEGTRTLAEGNYAHRITVRATDEFGLLINSFNTMAGELGTQREALTESNAELQNVNLWLDREREYLSTVLESVSSGIIAFTHQYELLSINRAAMRMLQLPVLPVRTRLDQQFEGELASLRAYIVELGGARPPRPHEITVIRGGELRYLEVSAERLTSDEGGWVLAIEDSTQLVQAQKLAAWSEAARRIAHEIKNPLTPIQLSAERIARQYRSGDENVGKVIEEGTRTIVNEVGQLKRMVDEFSRFARMPAIHLRDTEITAVLQEVAGLYREVKPGVSVAVDADPQLRAVVDPEQIRRAMINLLDNAVEATGSGIIEVAAKKSDRKLMIRVSDPGRGVPDSDKERLFLPYFSTKGRGTGLGLAIVHRIVHDHDGRISVHDNHPRGTTFQIELPA